MWLVWLVIPLVLIGIVGIQESYAQYEDKLPNIDYKELTDRLVEQQIEKFRNDDSIIADSVKYEIFDSKHDIYPPNPDVKFIYDQIVNGKVQHREMGFVLKFESDGKRVIGKLGFLYVKEYLPALKNDAGPFFVCKQGFETVERYSGHSVCIKPESISKLVDRGWLHISSDVVTILKNQNYDSLHVPVRVSFVQHYTDTMYDYISIAFWNLRNIQSNYSIDVVDPNGEKVEGCSGIKPQNTQEPYSFNEWKLILNKDDCTHKSGNYMVTISSDPKIIKKVAVQNIEEYSNTIEKDEPIIELNDGYSKTYVVTMNPHSWNPACSEFNNCYSPSEVSINVGDTVKWINESKNNHDVASGDPLGGMSGLFYSGLVLPNQNYTFTFEEPGIYTYFSLIGPWVEGRIIVGDTATNLPPTVFAGDDQIVSENSRVTLSGYGTDPEDESLSYMWEQISGTKVNLSGSSHTGFPTRSQSTSFNTHDVNTDETLIFQLTTTDSVRQSATDTVSITIKNSEELDLIESVDVEELFFISNPDINISTYALQHPDLINLKKLENSSLRISPLLKTNPEAFNSNKVMINLFEDSFLVKKMYIRYYGDGGFNFNWVGEVIGMESLNVVLGINNNQVVTGLIKTQTNSYVIKSIGNGYSVILDLDRSMSRQID